MSYARDLVIKFILATKNETFGEHKILVEGSKKDAELLRNRMRVELSRLRTHVINEGGTVKPFKMIVKHIKELPSENNRQVTELVLIRDSRGQETWDKIDQIFDVLSGGERIHD